MKKIAFAAIFAAIFLMSASSVSQERVNFPMEAPWLETLDTLCIENPTPFIIKLIVNNVYFGAVQPQSKKVFHRVGFLIQSEKSKKGFEIGGGSESLQKPAFNKLIYDKLTLEFSHTPYVPKEENNLWRYLKFKKVTRTRTLIDSVMVYPF